MKSHIAAQESECPLPITSLKKITAWVVMTAAILSGCAKSPPSFEQMGGEDKLNFLRAQADEAMLVQATNGVPNIHDVIEANADTFSGSVEQWRGWVRLDFVGQSGAIQQTNIPMTFVASYDGRLFGCVPHTGSALINLR